MSQTFISPLVYAKQYEHIERLVRSRTRKHAEQVAAMIAEAEKLAPEPYTNVEPGMLVYLPPAPELPKGMP